MSLDKLSKYKVNKAFTEGVVINLSDAPDVDFLVRLPGQYNRAYMAEVYGSLNLTFDDDGKPVGVANVIATRQLQEEAFLKHCLLAIDGEPTPVGFAEEYPKAIEELMVEAGKLVDQIAKGVDEGVKKSAPTLIGNANGTDG